MLIKYQTAQCVSKESIDAEEKLSCFSHTILYGRGLNPKYWSSPGEPDKSVVVSISCRATGIISFIHFRAIFYSVWMAFWKEKSPTPRIMCEPLGFSCQSRMLT